MQPVVGVELWTGVAQRFEAAWMRVPALGWRLATGMCKVPSSCTEEPYMCINPVGLCCLLAMQAAEPQTSPTDSPAAATQVCITLRVGAKAPFCLLMRSAAGQCGRACSWEQCCLSLTLSIETSSLLI